MESVRTTSLSGNILEADKMMEEGEGGGKKRKELFFREGRAEAVRN